MKEGDDLRDLLVQKLQWLRLPGMAKLVAALLDRAAKDNLSTLDVIHRLCDEEKQSRMQERRRAAHPRRSLPRDQHHRRVRLRLRPPSERRCALATSPCTTSAFLDEGDQSPLHRHARHGQNVSRPRARLPSVPGHPSRRLRRRLHACSTNLHGAELHGTLERALRRYVRAELLVIDDFAVLAMDPAQAKLAFQVISERYDFRRSTCITTNRAFKDWTKVFPDALNAQVIAERLTERAEHFVLEKGFRTARP